MRAIILYLFLGLVLTITGSLFYPFWAWFLIAVFAAFGASLAVRIPCATGRASKLASSDLISLVSCGSCFLLWMKPNILYVQNWQAFDLLRDGLGICLILSIARLCAGICRCHRVAITLAVGFIIVLLALRILVIYASPDPHIDVFVIMSKACQALLSGHNPYTQSFPDIYAGKYGYKPQFSWWPVHFIYPLPFYLLGDVRLGSIFADGVTAFLLTKIARKLGLPKDFGLTAAGAWLCFPVSLHVTEQSWIEPVLAMFSALLTLSLLNRKWYQAGLWIGIMCATKQFMPIVAVETFAFLYSANRKPLCAVLAGALFAFSALMLPFIAINPSPFVEATVTSFITRPMRLDSLSIPSLVAYVAGVTIDGRLLAAIYTFVLGFGAIALARVPRAALGHWLTALVLVFGVIVLFGKQAFCNYYTLLSFFVLVRSVFAFGEALLPDAGRLDAGSG